jgi:pimeloyl-ACP methyl ester carboxylesterase
MSEASNERPLAGALAFVHGGPVAEWSQAAQLVAMGMRLNGPEDAIEEMMAEGAPLSVPETPRSPWGEQQVGWSQLAEIVANLPIPDIGFEWYGGEERSFSFRRQRPEIERFVYREFGADLWRMCSHRDAGAVAALRLMAASLYSESEIVRVSGATALSPLLSDPGPLLESVLVDGLLSDSTTVRTMAAHALAARDSEHPALTEPDDDRPGDPEPTRTSITIHGTFARFGSAWWKPGHEFHHYLRSRCSPDLYGGTDHYRWDGRYDEACREAGAKDLAGWCHNHHVEELDTVYAHSHGGNVALNAAQDESVKTKLLILISTPARSRSEHEWNRILSNVRRVVSLRSRFDLVILGDRSRLRFDAHVRQLLPPGLWFSHGALLKTKTWDRYDLPNEIAYERGLATPTPTHP